MQKRCYKFLLVENLFMQINSELDKNMSRILKRNDISEVEKVQMYNQVLRKYLAISCNKTNEAELESKREEESFKRKHSEYNIEQSKKRKIECNDQSYDEMFTAKDTYNDSYNSNEWADFDTDIPFITDDKQMNALNRAVLKRTFSEFMNVLRD